MKCVILAGGVGSRFWPYSRKNNPKQLLKIFGDKSMLQITVDRLAKIKKINATLFKSILNLKKLNQDINFIANFGRDVEYYTGIVFEVLSGKKEIARGGRYDDLLKSLGAKKNTPAVGADINLKNL